MAGRIGVLLLVVLLLAVFASGYRDEEEDGFSLGRWEDTAEEQQQQHRSLRRQRRRRHNNNKEPARPNKAAPFDFYVLASFWPPELCHNEATNACQMPEPWWKVNLTGHGLWPNNDDGTYPQFCPGAKYNSSIIDNDITLPVMMMLWPNYQHDISEGEQIYDNLWEHEWNKHGTCTGLSQEAYFKLALKGFLVATPPALAAASQAGTRSMPLTQLQSYFGGPEMAGLQCGGSRYFSGVYTCWSRDNTTHAPLARIKCPPSIVDKATCKASTIQIPLFQ